MNALFSMAFVDASALAMAFAGMGLGFLLALLWSNSRRGTKKPKRKGLLWADRGNKNRIVSPQESPPLESETGAEKCKADTPCPLCLGHEDPAIGKLLARRRIFHEMIDDICERCRLSQRTLREEILGESNQQPYFRSKICPRCRERYHLGHTVCGRDGEELVLLN